MSNHFLTLLSGVMSLAAVAILPSRAQDASQQTPPLPIDKDVRMGKLDNGLTYIIRHNEKPKDRATSTSLSVSVASSRRIPSAVSLTSLSTWPSRVARTSPARV